MKKELNELQVPLMKAYQPEEFQVALLARVRAQNERLRPLIEKVLGKPDLDAKIPTAEELQQLLFEEGIKPEDNLGSRAIVEEREK